MHSKRARILPRRLRSPAPIPKKAIPGSPSQIAYIGPRNGAAAGVTGRAVVVRFRVEVTGLAEGIVTGFVVKLQLAWLGTFAVQAGESLPPCTRFVVSATG